MVIVKDTTEPAKAIQVIKQALSEQVKRAGNPKGAQPLDNGKVVIKYKDEDQKAIFGNELRKRNDLFTIVEQRQHKPTFTVCGVYRGYLDEEIKSMIVAENEDIDREVGRKLIETAKVLTRKKCRNEKKENVTFEAHTDVVRYMIRKESINLDFGTSYINEAVNVTICFNCHRFGHVIKYCTHRTTCQHCGGPHDGLECKEETQDCINCRTLRIPADQRRHSARDRDCPVFIRKENAARRRVDY